MVEDGSFGFGRYTLKRELRYRTKADQLSNGMTNMSLIGHDGIDRIYRRANNFSCILGNTTYDLRRDTSILRRLLYLYNSLQLNRYTNDEVSKRNTKRGRRTTDLGYLEMETSDDQDYQNKGSLVRHGTSVYVGRVCFVSVEVTLR